MNPQAPLVKSESKWRNYRIELLRSLSLAALLCALAQGAWAESVTFNVRYWDTTNKQVVTTPTTKDATVLTSYDDWVPLGANDKSVLYLGASNKLYYPSAAMNVNACRAVFVLNGLTAGDIATSRIKLNFEDDETTEIRPTPCPSLYGGEWYDLSGRKLNGKPTAKGLYIKDGKKVVIK